jgi:hypothetical protein
MVRTWIVRTSSQLGQIIAPVTVIMSPESGEVKQVVDQTAFCNSRTEPSWLAFNRAEIIQEHIFPQFIW